MKFKIRFVFFVLSTLFILYSISIYINPLLTNSNYKFNIEKAASGRLIWQKYNCQACHQLYGLGGYLGPDLTNIISKNNNADIYVKAMVSMGSRQMPAFKISEHDMDLLIEFLKSTNESGSADPRKLVNTNLGMVKSYGDK